MKRSASALILLAAVGGCVSTETGAPWTGGQGGGCSTCGPSGSAVPGVQGPWGQPVAMAAPYSAAPPGGEAAARAMMNRSMPMNMVQMNNGIQQASYHPGGGMPGGPPMPPGGALSPPGMPFSPGGQLPPSGPGAVAAVGALTGQTPSRFPSKRTEVRFATPATMRVSWYAASTDGKSTYTPNSLEVPGRYNFVQGNVYRLKISDVPNRPGLELYPTLEVIPSNPKTDAFLAHSAVPVAFTEEDFDQVAAGNFLVKVIYLPDPQFQDVATTGPDEVVSTRLEPGADPIAEAYRRGNILLIVRMGNIDLEAPNTPSMDAPSPYMLKPKVPQGPPGMGMGGMPMPGMAGMGGMPMPGMPGMPGMGGMPMPGMPPGAMAGGGMGLPPGVVMTPTGPVLMTPNGPMPLTRGAQLPPGGALPAMPTSQPQAAPAQPGTGPVSQLPDASLLQTQYPEAKDDAATTSKSSSKAAPAKPAQKKWLWGK